MLEKLPDKYKLRRVRYATVAEARHLTVSAFVKPADAANKCFDAGVYPGGWAILLRRGFPESTPVLIADPVTWDVEYRCFMLQGQVTTCSPYVRFGRWIRARDDKWIVPRPELDQVLAFCWTLVSDRSVRLPPAFTLDVGRIEGRAGPWSRQTRYGVRVCTAATLTEVLPVLRRACVQRNLLTQEDREWVVAR